jgi:Xaa-Pro aminopeptidase
MIIKSNTKYSRLNREFLTFDTVTLVPIQTRLLKISMLTEHEVSMRYIKE